MIGCGCNYFTIALGEGFRLVCKYKVEDVSLAGRLVHYLLQVEFRCQISQYLEDSFLVGDSFLGVRENTIVCFYPFHHSWWKLEVPSDYDGVVWIGGSHLPEVLF